MDKSVLGLYKITYPIWVYDKINKTIRTKSAEKEFETLKDLQYFVRQFKEKVEVIEDETP